MWAAKRVMARMKPEAGAIVKGRDASVFAESNCGL